MVKLTDVKIRSLKPAEKSYKVFDGRGLYLEVYPGGSKLWRLKYKFRGRESRKSLGPWPEVGLAEARDETGRIRSGLRRGDKPEGRAPKGVLLKDLTAEWLARNYGPDLKKPNTIKNITTLLARHVTPHLGSYRINDITKDVIINNMLNKIDDSPYMAKTALSTLVNILDYAVIKGDITINHARNLSGYLPPARLKHFSSLTSVDEFKTFLKALGSYPINIYSIVIKLLIYMFVRPGELIKANWSEFNFKDKLWTIPADRMKSGRPHIVPLSNQVIEILSGLPRINEKVFFNSATSKCITGQSVLKLLGKMGFANKATLHGFRATASTMLNQMGYNSDWIERQLAHTARGVRAVYNFADHLPQRIRMMGEWADHVDRLAKDE